MLEWLRRKKGSFIGLLLIGFCAILMLGFGLGSFGDGGNQQVAARVNDAEISYTEYYRYYRTLDDRMRGQMGEMYPRFRAQLNLEQRAIDTLISKRVFDDFFDAAGFTASFKQIEEKIALSPYFLQNGLSQNSMDRFLRATGLTMVGLQNETKREIISEQLNKLLSDMSVVSEVELKNIFEGDKAEASFKYVSFLSKDFEEKVDLNDTEGLTIHYEDNLEKFREPAKAKFDLVKFHPSNYRNAVEVTDDDLEISYQEMKQEGKFNVPAQIKLRQIMLKKATAAEGEEGGSELEKLVGGEEEKAEELASTEESNEAIKARLEELLDRLDKGEAFDALAKDYSEDERTRENGGDLGWSTYRGLDPKLANAARDLDLGEYSEVIDLPKGYYVILVEDSKDERVRNLEEVKQQVEATIRANLSSEYAFAEAEQLYDEWKVANQSLKDFAENKKLQLVKVEEFVDENEIAKTTVPGLSKKVIEYGPESKEIVELNGTTVLFETTEYIESTIPEFEVVKEKVQNSYKQEQKTILAKEAAENLLEAAKEKFNSGSKQPLDDAVEGTELKLEATEKATRMAARDAVFSSNKARETLFTLDENTPLIDEVLEAPLGYYVAVFVEREIPETANFDEEKKNLGTTEAKSSSDRLLTSLDKSLQSTKEIWIDPQLFDKQ